MPKGPERRFRIWDIAGHPGDGAASAPAAMASSDESRARARLPQSWTDLEAGSPESATSYELLPTLALEVEGTCRMPGLDALRCRSRSISPAAAVFAYDLDHAHPARASGASLTGRKTDLHLDRVGSISGLVTAQDLAEFSVAIDETCRESLRGRLSRIAKDANIPFDETPNRLDITRIEPDKKNCAFSDETGAVRKGKIVNFSQIDILIRTAIIPARNSHVIFRDPQRRLAKVTRSFETGFAANFCMPIPAHTFSAALKFIDE